MNLHIWFVWFVVRCFCIFNVAIIEKFEPQFYVLHQLYPRIFLKKKKKAKPRDFDSRRKNHRDFEQTHVLFLAWRYANSMLQPSLLGFIACFEASTTRQRHANSRYRPLDRRKALGSKGLLSAGPF